MISLKKINAPSAALVAVGTSVITITLLSTWAEFNHEKPIATQFGSSEHQNWEVRTPPQYLIEATPIESEEELIEASESEQEASDCKAIEVEQSKCLLNMWKLNNLDSLENENI